MLYLYILALFFIALGAIAWLVTKKIVWQEWAGGSIAAILLAGIFHAIAFYGQTSDVEMWRGEVVKVVFYPEWVEEYEVAVYKTVTRTRTVNGKTQTYTDRVFSHYEDRYRTHHEYWEAETNINITPRIGREVFNEIGQRFGGNRIAEQVYKSGFHRGDRNIYFYRNETGWVEPVNDTKRWDNRLKAAPSIYDFAEVSEEQVEQLFEWPNNDNWRVSNTLLGDAGEIEPLAWDQLAAKLGPTRQANLIFVGFPAGTPSTTAQWQQAYWAGGKKNDVVICVAINNNRAEWVHSFGWSNNAQVWAELNEIMLYNQFNNDILPLIEKAVVSHYERKEWEEFKHLEVQPPTWVYWVFPLVLLLTQGGLYVWFHYNEYVENTIRCRF